MSHLGHIVTDFVQIVEKRLGNDNRCFRVCFQGEPPRHYRNKKQGYLSLSLGTPVCFYAVITLIMSVFYSKEVIVSDIDLSFLFLRKDCLYFQEIRPHGKTKRLCFLQGSFPKSYWCTTRKTDTVESAGFLAKLANAVVFENIVHILVASS